ncbi:MAG: RNA polymerase sigma-70 factor [Thalassobius sp.]|nr:RNA polymerase sigma-70 factor [Thalassovita sp.]
MLYANYKDYHNSSDQDLFDEIKRGDQQAFNELFNRYWKSLYAFSFSTFQDSNLSEDATQEVFTSLWEKRQKLIIQNIRAYLFQAVKFQIAANIRKSRFTDLHIKTIDKINYIRDVEEQMNYQELDKKLENTLQELPERCREIFYMSRFEHLSNQEIADKLNISKRTVENQISRALQKVSSSIETSYFIFLLVCYFVKQ